MPEKHTAAHNNVSRATSVAVGKFRKASNTAQPFCCLEIDMHNVKKDTFHPITRSTQGMRSSLNSKQCCLHQHLFIQFEQLLAQHKMYYREHCVT